MVSHFALTSYVSNSSWCFMESLSYVCFVFFKCTVWTYLMPQLVLKWRTSLSFLLKNKLFTELIYERERYFDTRLLGEVFMHRFCLRFVESRSQNVSNALVCCLTTSLFGSKWTTCCFLVDSWVLISRHKRKYSYLNISQVPFLCLECLGDGTPLINSLQ